MHDSRKVFLLEGELRCIKAAYEAGDDAGTTEFKTFDAGIAVDDYIIVPSGTRHEMTICKVHEVDVEPNLDSGSEMLWVIGKVSLSGHEATVASEERFIAAARSAERARKMKQLKEDILADVDADIKVIAGPVDENTDAHSETSAPASS